MVRKLQKVDEVKEAIEVGKFYLVPCIKNHRAFWWTSAPYVPVFGPLHDDAEIIGFPAKHYHIDWRFVTDNEIYSIPSYTLAQANGEAPQTMKLYGLVCSEEFVSKVVYKKRLCRREFPQYQYVRYTKPNRTWKLHWMGALEEAYKDCTLQCGVCPHRGLNLASIAPKGELITCPGHGLNWNARTGKLVSHRDIGSDIGKRSNAV